MNRVSAAFAVIVLLAPSAVAAQGAVTLTPGQRIRVTESGPEERQLRGTVISTSGDSIALRVDESGSTARIAFASLSRVDVSRGMKRRTGAGFGYGFLAGAAAGAGVGLAACGAQRGCDGGNSEMNSPQFYMVAHGILGAGLGGILGAIIGSRSQREAWTTVPPARWHVQTTPGINGSLALSASRTF